MKEIKVNLQNPYSIVVTSTNAQLPFWLEQKKLNKLYVITDENVDALYKDYFSILSNKIIGKYVIKAGEENKNIDTVMKIYNKLLSENIDRKCALIAFGGGVVGDVTGFVAATFKRGTKFIQVPTTIVAQTDSSIGGKNGFNYEGIKNIIGTFYQPDLVYVDVNLLKTLDYKYFKDGMAEVIKYAYSLDANLFRFLEENKKAIKEKEIDKLKHIVTECAKLKASIVEKDVFDEGLRHLLNFGHTVGHAIETVSNFSVGHGEAVAMGMVYETYIAYKRNYIDYNKLERLINLIQYFELPIEYNIDDYKKFGECIVKDKKNIDNLIKIVLPKDIGHAIIASDLKLDTIIQYINEFTRM